MTKKSDKRMAGDNTPTFASRWRGKFRAANREGDSRYDALARKYLSDASGKRRSSRDTALDRHPHSESDSSPR